MFIRSAANDTLQGRAIQAVNEKWGKDFRKWAGRETIGIPVCKKKYTPFSFSIARPSLPSSGSNESVEGSDSEEDSSKSRLQVEVKRMYGCKCHSDIRKAVIEQHGVRKGWEPFGQWSMKKAQELARRESERLNQARLGKSPPESEGSGTDSSTSIEEWTSDEERAFNNLPTSMCNNGSCTWKVRAKYDNIFKEIHGRSESDDEE